VCNAQISPLVPGSLPARIGQVFSWLPADTETILVANQPFAMPAFKHYDADEPSRETSLAELTERFELLPLSLFELKDQVIHIAKHARRHFQFGLAREALRCRGRREGKPARQN
jgi:hypothetical protein